MKETKWKENKQLASSGWKMRVCGEGKQKGKERKSYCTKKERKSYCTKMFCIKRQHYTCHFCTRLYVQETANMQNLTPGLVFVHFDRLKVDNSLCSDQIRIQQVRIDQKPLMEHVNAEFLIVPE